MRASKAPKEQGPATAIANALRILADYLESEERARETLIENIKKLRIENIKLRINGSAEKTSGSPPEPAKSRKEPVGEIPKEELTAGGEWKKNRRCNCKRHDRDPKTIPWPGCPTHGENPKAE